MMQITQMNTTIKHGVKPRTQRIHEIQRVYVKSVPLLQGGEGARG
mgnify:FL=1